SPPDDRHLCPFAWLCRAAASESDGGDGEGGKGDHRAGCVRSPGREQGHYEKISVQITMTRKYPLHGPRRSVLVYKNLAGAVNTGQGNHDEPNALSFSQYSQ